MVAITTCSERAGSALRHCWQTPENSKGEPVTRVSPPQCAMAELVVWQVGDILQHTCPLERAASAPYRFG